MRVYVANSGHIWFIVYFWFCRFVAGCFLIFWCNSLIINTIHFSGLHAISGGFCLEYDIWDFGIFFMWVTGCLGLIVILEFIRVSKRAKAEGQPKGQYFRFVSGVFMCFGT